MKRFEKQEEERIGITASNINLHMIFTGSPGAGKTTVARLYGHLLREIGVLKQGQFIEASRADLVAKYSGHTAPTVKKICQAAMGGVLFIDEAYSLCLNERDYFGLEAIGALIKEMEDHRENLVVILAGYTNEMDKFLNTNPGIASRISKILNFTDYTIEELWNIFKSYAAAGQFTHAPKCESVIKERIEFYKQDLGANFGNAREVRKIFENGKTNMISRVQRENIQGDERRKMLPEDFIATND